MKQTRMLLQTLFCLPILLSALLALLFETCLLLPGDLTGNPQTEFVVTIVMELLTICLIPIALRMFKVKSIDSSLKTEGAKALKKWGSLRIAMLGVPLFVNTLLYYLFLNTTFGYMAIITLISMVFIFPSAEKCEYETLGDNSEL